MNPTKTTPHGDSSRDDGVSKVDAGGRTGGGESGGGAYKDKDQVTGNPKAQGFMGHGGQSKIAYHGPGDKNDGGGNENAVAEEE